jgi:hypothetical protein
MALGPCSGRTTGSPAVPSNSLLPTCGQLFLHVSGAHALSRRASVRDPVGSVGSLTLRTRGPYKSSSNSSPSGILCGPCGCRRFPTGLSRSGRPTAFTPLLLHMPPSSLVMLTFWVPVKFGRLRCQGSASSLPG